MPRINRQSYKSEILKFVYDVYVNTAGVFSTTLPQDVVEQLVTVGIKLGVNRKGNEGYFCAESLGELRGKVQDTVDQFSDKELVDEKVILRYSLDTACSYCKTSDGIPVPNGTYKGVVGDWHGGTLEVHANTREPYGFSCSVRPIRIKTWRFPNGEIRAEELRPSNGAFDYDETLKWLDDLSGMNIVGKTKDIDYSPKLGLFFKSIILYIINLNEKLKTVFGSDIEISLPALGNIKLLTHHSEDIAEEEVIPE